MADDKIGTHYEGCEQYHLECAKQAIADRDRRIETLTKALRDCASCGCFACNENARHVLASAAGAEGEA